MFPSDKYLSIFLQVFKTRKFQDQFLVKVREAISHACSSFANAAMLEFLDTDTNHLTRDPHSVLPLFKEWLSKARKTVSTNYLILCHKDKVLKVFKYDIFSFLPLAVFFLK